METKVYNTKEEAANYIADTIENIVKNKKDALICLAAGHTSLPVFEELVLRNKKGSIDFANVCVVGLDEWLNIKAEDFGSCAYFLNTNIYNRLNLKKENIRLFDGMAKDGVLECREVEEFIERKGGIDYLLLGIGMNGHLALNEPGDSFENGAHPVALSDTTKNVAPKYFKEDMPKLEGGITLGIKNLLKAKQIQLAIFGEKKRALVHQLIESAPTESLPATALKNAKNAQLIVDKEAY